jgi:hypothetical protein
MNEALYFPIHRAKKGEIVAAGRLSPKTLTRVRPTFEVQKPNEGSKASFEEYLGGIAAELSKSWDHRFPLFVDLPHFAPDDRTADGKHCVEYLFRCLRQHGMLGIPMTARSLSVVLAMAISTPLPPSRESMRETIAFPPQPYRSTEGLVSLLLEPLRHVASAGFRNIVICGSCIPESVDKRYNGRAMRVPRTDLLAWQVLVGMFSDVLVKRGDSGVVYALEQDVSGPARPLHGLGSRLLANTFCGVLREKST